LAWQRPGGTGTNVITTRDARTVHTSLNFSKRVGTGPFSGVQQSGRRLWGHGDRFMAFREKISSDPLFVEIRWYTHTKPYEL